MIISPPFLPAPVAGETDEAFLERAMVGGVPGDGGFPLSFDLNWHGGVHLSSPKENEKFLPVRAIADGKLAYFRNPEAEVVDADHPLRFRRGWTDNGCIVLRHETEIGEGAQSTVVFYSIYMHLSKINLSQPQVGMTIHRKDNIGEAGSIYGEKGRIHFEIVADQSQIAHLVGRATRDLDYQSNNGRTDSCWGDMYFFVPPEVLLYGAAPGDRRQPQNNAPVVYRCPAMPTNAPVQEAGSPSPSASFPSTVDGYEWAVASQLQQGIFVRMSYERGQCTLTSFYVSGVEIGAQQEETNYEYNLYTTANQLYPQSPSAGYELLRFGRVLGTDTIQPADAAHWRQIKFPGKAGEQSKVGWVNLNALTVTKFSDADFPQWQGWRLIDDDVDTDSHCQSPFIRSLLELGQDTVRSSNNNAVSIAKSPGYEALSQEEKQQLSERYSNEHELSMSRLSLPDIQKQIKRLVCKFPTEWALSDFDARYEWLLKVSDGGPMSQDKYDKLKAYQSSLAFWEQADLVGIDSKHWHFHPLEFIRVFRKCGWFSNDELLIILKQAPATGRQRAAGLRMQTNKMLAKYLISSSKLRVTHFFAQVGVETGWWQYREEIGNERYFRTMYEVITPVEAGEDYDRAVSLQRNLPSGRRPVELPNPGPRPKPTINRPNYVAARPSQIAAKAAGMDNGIANSSNGGMVGDGNRFHGRGFLQITGRRNYKSYEKYRGKNFTSDPNPALLSSDDYNACDASGFFWSRERINRRADQGSSAETSRVVGSIINLGNPNGTPNHNTERQQALEPIWEALNDKV
ncbi:M23 family metallopeptidase [Pseudomonas chlororaphis]|uniref:M23 family metallopeptidase n=1 Tax=Pseudomonas chlororaphis TaxID=587753 RepID=UPI001CF34736|nr:M23 family metallopeptidase [Pseudomonas chlororaphis]UCR83642.1 M23 family metallopeptidase [Pseudomonas chlororaphis]